MNDCTLNLNEIIHRIATYEWILIISFGIALYFRNWLWSLFLFCVVLFELIITYYAAILFGSNIFAYNLYVILCISFYIYLLYLHLKLSNRLKTAVLGITSLWLLFALFSLFHYKNTNHVNVLAYHTGMFIVLVLAISYLKFNLLSEKSWNIMKDPLSYFCIGLLIYYTSSFPIITTANYLITNTEANEAFSTLLLIGNIFLSLGYLGAVLCTKKEAQYIG